MTPEPRLVAWLDPLENRAWRALLRVGWLVDAAVSRDLAVDAGLSHPDYMVLVTVSEADGGTMRMSEVADALVWSRSRLSHQVARMESRDLVTRRADPDDARGALCSLTPLGRATLERAAPGHVASVRANVLDALSREELAALARVGERLVARLSDEAGPTEGALTA